jgi:hypothetical protein
MRENRLQHTLTVLRHLTVPEAKHAPALAEKIGIADLIAQALAMLRPVGLSDQP